MTDLLLNEEEKMLQAAVRDFADRELVPRAKTIDEREEFSFENWNGMSALGLTGIGIPEDLDGSGGGYRQVCIAVEEIARGDASASVCLISHLSLGSRTIFEYSNEEQKQKYIPTLSRGESISAWALTEPNAGTDAAAIQTTATSHNSHYYLNGTKIFISNGDIADYIVVFATQDTKKRAHAIIALVVETSAEGLHINPQHGKLGMRGSTTSELVFEDAQVPKTNRLGEEGQGFKYAMEILNSSRIVIGAQCVGIAQAAFEAAILYVQQRKSFGKPISEHQAIQFKLADMATKIHAARIMTLHAATLKDQGHSFVKEASMAKLFASEMAIEVTTSALHLYGGYGFFKEAPVERYLRDAQVTTIYEGTSEIQRLIIARQLLQQHVI